jgi:hypothetical protein
LLDAFEAAFEADFEVDVEGDFEADVEGDFEADFDGDFEADSDGAAPVPFAFVTEATTSLAAFRASFIRSSASGVLSPARPAPL